VTDNEQGQASATSELPPTIGRPATQGLLNAGLVTLDDVSSKSEAELLAIHGVGPKAVRILTEALERRRRSP
jgi:hypothetical protein